MNKYSLLDFYREIVNSEKSFGIDYKNLSKQLIERIDKAIKMLYKLEENMNKDLKLWYGAGLNIKHFEVRDIRNIIKLLGDKENERRR